MRLPIRPEHRRELDLLYSEPHRHYHTMSHIAIMFSLATAHGLKLSVPQQLAIFYHDAIYNPTRKDNEEQSNSLFLRHHSGTLLPQYTNRVSSIILDTKTHIASCHESFDVLDLDLAGLGFDFDTYMYASEQIRQEYIHLPEDTWIANRKLFLKSMLDKDNLFHTHWGKDFYQIKAMRNMEKELNLLS